MQSHLIPSEKGEVLRSVTVRVKDVDLVREIRMESLFVGHDGNLAGRLRVLAALKQK
jgi:hypothetical protein